MVLTAVTAREVSMAVYCIETCLSVSALVVERCVHEQINDARMDGTSRIY